MDTFYFTSLFHSDDVGGNNVMFLVLLFLEYNCFATLC